ncbi:hypothetical protein N8T08_007118 [Aspergillus melleus]|uniref:Uncharacterized protein n=1 Tax=Aspergillus melleus TaxID=138277 RepID=A0ACC3AYH8_9EURO|nr:hypothetical protein N8T08_007118 [Aspergillus melleus]
MVPDDAPTNINRDEKCLSSEDLARGATEEPAHLTGVRLFLVVLALLLGMFLIALDMNIVSTAIPNITAQFHSVDTVGWYASSFFLTLACFQSPWGKAYKYFPLKTTFSASVVLFEAGSLIAGVAQNNTTFIVGRAITGVGGAGITGGVYIITALSVKPTQVPVYLGLLGAVFSCASVCGPLLGGVFTDKASWRWCFYINLPVGGFVLLILIFFFRTTGRHKPTPASWADILLQMDPLGVLTILCAMVCYCLALQWGGVHDPWNSSRVIGTLIAWVLLTVIFGIDQWMQGEKALLVPRFLQRREIAVCCAFIFFLNSSNFLLIYNLPVYFQAIDNVSPMGSGIRNLPLMLASSICTLLSGTLIKYVKGRFQLFLVVGSAVQIIGAGMLYTLGLHPSAGQYIGYQILVGVGVGLSIQIPVMACQALVDPVDIPVVTAMVLFFQLISGALSVSAAQSIFDNQLVAGLAIYAPSVSSASVFAAGATEFRDMFPNSQLQGILLAYLKGIKASWVLGIALSGMAVLVSWVPMKRLGNTPVVAAVG